MTDEHPLLGNPFIDIGLPIALFVIMIGIGLSLTHKDFAHEARDPRGAIVGTLGQILLMPSLGLLIAWLLALPPVVAVGLVIIAACPGGTTSNLIAYLARANVALSIVLTVVASLITIVTLPIFANVALSIWPTGSGEEIRVPVLRTIALLLVLVLVPVLIGMLIRARRPALAASAERAVSLFGAVILAALILVISISLGGEFWTYLRQAGVPTILLNVGGLAVGFGIMSLARTPLASRITGAVELGIKNATIGILIAINVIGQPEMAVPSGTYGLLMYVSAAAVVLYGRRAGRPEAQPEAVG